MNSSENLSTSRENSQGTNNRPMVVIGIILAGLVAITAIGLSNQEDSNVARADANLDPAVDSAKPLPVNTIRISLQSDVTQTQSFTGTIRARQSSDLAFESPGTITEVLVREGEAVTEGQVLARLDARTVTARRAAIVAQLDQANAMLDEMNAGPRTERIR